VDHSRAPRRLAGTIGAVAAGLGGAQSLDAAVQHTPVDVTVSETPTTEYHVDLNGDAINEFDIQHFASIVKVADFAKDPDTMVTTTGVVVDPNDSQTANLPAGTLIGPASDFSVGGPSGGDRLNGTIEVEGSADIDDDGDVDGNDLLLVQRGLGDPHDADDIAAYQAQFGRSDTFFPSGNFQVSAGPGFIGVQFQIAGNTHYGYVGYEGTGAENNDSGRIFALGYEDQPNTAIQAGAGIPPGLTGVSAVPEPASLSMLAAGAAGMARYRRRSTRET
jgi:hypothetical protein